jgi:hypothetical protein
MSELLGQINIDSTNKEKARNLPDMSHTNNSLKMDLFMELQTCLLLPVTVKVLIFTSVFVQRLLFSEATME